MYVKAVQPAEDVPDPHVVETSVETGERQVWTPTKISTKSWVIAPIEGNAHHHEYQHTIVVVRARSV